MKRILGLLAALFLAASPLAAFAAPIPYYTGPNDVPNVMVNSVVANINATLPAAQYTTFCTGTTTSTCTGLRLAIATTGLTTAHGALAAAMTVTDTSVVAPSQVICQVMGYAGTGTPIAVNVIPAAGTFTFQVQNNDPSAALNATVVTDCFVYN